MYKDGDMCPICGSGALTKKSIEETFDYKGKSITIKDYLIFECPVCEESIVEQETLKNTEPILIDFRRKVDNLLTPNEIKEIRLLFGYTQENFAELLGGGKKAFARYENGAIAQSRAMDHQLKMLRNNPSNILVLRVNSSGYTEYIHRVSTPYEKTEYVENTTTENFLKGLLEGTVGSIKQLSGPCLYETTA